MTTWLNELVDITREQYIWMAMIIPAVLIIFAYFAGKHIGKDEAKKRSNRWTNLPDNVINYSRYKRK